MTRYSAHLLLTLVAACGSSSGNADAISAGQGGDGGVAGGTRKDAATGACSALSPAGAVFSWQDNGTPECAVVVEATRMTSSTQDFLEIVSGTSTALGWHQDHLRWRVQHAHPGHWPLGRAVSRHDCRL